MISFLFSWWWWWGEGNKAHTHSRLRFYCKELRTEQRVYISIKKTYIFFIISTYSYIRSWSPLLAPMKFKYVMWNIFKNESSETFLFYRELMFDTKEQTIKNNLKQYTMEGKNRKACSVTGIGTLSISMETHCVTHLR